MIHFFKKILVVLLFLFFLTNVYSGHDTPKFDPGGECTSGCGKYNSKYPNAFDYEHGDISTVPPDKVNFNQIQQYNRWKDLTESQWTYGIEQNKIKDADLAKLGKRALDELEKSLKKLYDADIDINDLPQGSFIENGVLKAGDSTINLKDFKGTHTIDARDGKLLVDGNEYIGAQNVKSDGNSVSIDAVKSLNTPFGQVLNGKNVRVFGDRVEGDYATAFMQNGAVASDIYNFNSKTIKFGVEQADSLLSGNIKVESIENTEFTINSDKIIMVAGNGTTLHITGKGFIEVEFEAFGNDSEIAVYTATYVDWPFDSNIVARLLFPYALLISLALALVVGCRARARHHAGFGP